MPLLDPADVPINVQAAAFFPDRKRTVVEDERLAGSSDNAHVVLARERRRRMPPGKEASPVLPGFADWCVDKYSHGVLARHSTAGSMLILFRIVFGTLGAALGKVMTARPAWCVSDGLLNGQQLVRVGTHSGKMQATSQLVLLLHNTDAVKVPGDPGDPGIWFGCRPCRASEASPHSNHVARARNM